MFARLQVLQSTPDQQDTGLEIVRDQLLPWLRDSSGYPRLALKRYEATLFDV